MTRQAIYIVRYGLTQYPLRENLGPYDSDIDPTTGIEHADAIATSIASASPKEDLPTLVYASPFLRTTHTAVRIARKLNAKEANVKVRVEEGLYEWLTPSLLVEPNGKQTYPRSTDQLAEIFPVEVDTSYFSLNGTVPDDEDADGAPKFEEDEAALLVRCAKTTQALLRDADGKSFVIVSHAPCDQAIAMHLEGVPSPAESKLGSWPLGGVTKFVRTMKEDDGTWGEWTLEAYGNTDHMPGEYRGGLKFWSLPCLANK